MKLRLLLLGLTLIWGFGLAAQPNPKKPLGLPQFLQKTYINRSYSEYDSTYNPYDKATYIGVKDYLPASVKSKFSQERKQEQIPSNKSAGFEKKGYLNRTFTAGSTQQAGGNSNLDLQFKGELSPGFLLEGNLTDRRLPFQAEGNTTTLRELDRIYIKGSGAFGNVEAGDKNISDNGTSKFLAYNRRIQGLRYSRQTENMSLYAGTAAARGKFASVTIIPKESVWGPYRIPGPDGEWAIMVLSGSEKVYLDGVLLQRGSSLGYNIDYNMGEITFGAQVTITRFSRIRVEYQAFTQSYRRTIQEAGLTYRLTPGLEISIHRFSESDDPQKPLLFTPGKGIEQVLSYSGSQTGQGYISSIKPSGEYKTGEIQYRKTITLSGDTALEHVSSPTTEQLFTATFLQVNQGDYEQGPLLAQGYVFVYKGKGLGHYLPVQQIATPMRKSLNTIQTKWQPTSGQSITTEVAFQNNAVNLFSDVENKANALFVGYQWQKKVSTNWTLQTDLGARHNSEGFIGIDRFRALEWSRMWSLPGQDSALPSAEKNHRANLSFTHTKGDNIRLTAEHLDRKNFVSGYSYKTDFLKTFGRFTATGSFGQNTHSLLDKKVSRRDEYLELKLPMVRGWQTSYVWQGEKSGLASKNSDSLWAGGLWFEQQSLIINKRDSLELPAELRLSRRQDAGVKEGRRSVEWEAYQLDGKFKILDKELQGIWNYRTNKNLWSPQAQIEKNLSAGIDWNRKRKNELIQFALAWQTATGRELKRDYRFVLSPVPGMGTHKWMDFNNDGQQQPDEFVEALLPEEKQYIKLLAPTQETVPAYQSRLSFNGTLAMPQTFAPNGPIGKFLKKIEWNTIAEAERKTTDSRWANRINPYAVSENDAAALSNREVLVNRLLINPNQTKWSIKAQSGLRSQRFLQSQGFDSRQSGDLILEASFSPGTEWQIIAAKTRLNQKVTSNYLDARNYAFGTDELSFETRWQPGTKSRYSMFLRHGQKQPQSASPNLGFTKLGAEVRYALDGGTGLNFRLQRFDFSWAGDTGSAMAYEMLEAFQPGKNYQWQCDLDHTTSSGIKIGFRYEGRQMPSRPLIHFGTLNLGMAF